MAAASGECDVIMAPAAAVSAPHPEASSGMLSDEDEDAGTRR